MNTMRLILSCLIYFKHAQCEYRQFSRPKLASNNYFKHTDKKLLSVSPTITLTIAANGCVATCHQLADACKSINFFGNGTNFNQCEIFDDKGTPEYAEGWTYVTKCMVSDIQSLKTLGNQVFFT